MSSIFSANISYYNRDKFPDLYPIINEEGENGYWQHTCNKDEWEEGWSVYKQNCNKITLEKLKNKIKETILEKESDMNNNKQQHPSIANNSQNKNLGVNGLSKVNRCQICTMPSNNCSCHKNDIKNKYFELECNSQSDPLKLSLPKSIQNISWM
jgi:hypothetical protein